MHKHAETAVVTFLSASASHLVFRCSLRQGDLPGGICCLIIEYQMFSAAAGGAVRRATEAGASANACPSVFLFCVDMFTVPQTESVK